MAKFFYEYCGRMFTTVIGLTSGTKAVPLCF